MCPLTLEVEEVQLGFRKSPTEFGPIQACRFIWNTKLKQYYQMLLT